MPVSPSSIARLAIVVALAIMALAPAAAAQAPRQLVLVESDTWIRPGDPFTFDLQVIGDTADAVVDVIVYAPVTTREQFHEGLIAGPVGARQATGSVELAQVQVATNQFRLALPTDAGANADPANGADQLPRLDASSPGVIEIEVLLRRSDSAASASDTVEDRMLLHAVVVPERSEAGPPLATALVVPFAARPSLAADGTTEMSPDTLAQLEAVAAALASVPDVPLTLAMRPETVEALDNMGTDRATQLLDRLRLSVGDREVLATPFVSLDIDRWLRTGLASDVADQLGQGVNVLTDALAVAPQPGIWIAGTDVQQESITYLVNLGYDAGIVLPEEAVALDASRGSTPSLGQRFDIVDSNGVNQPAFLLDRAVQRHFDRTGNDVLDAHVLLADLSMVALANPLFARGIIVQPPTGTTPRLVFMEHVLAGITEHPLLDPMTTSALFDTVSPAVLASDAPDGPPIQRDLVAADIDPIGLTRLRGEAQSSLVSIANVLPAAFDTTPALRRLLLVSASNDLTENEQEQYLRTIIERIRIDADAISATAPLRVTLSSRDGIVPVTIRNASEADLQILVSLASDKLSFPDGARNLHIVPPGLTELDLRVQARTSGDAALDLTLSSPDRGIELEATRVTVRSTALSGVGIVIAAIALAFLCVWWIRNMRSGRGSERPDAAVNVDLLVTPGTD